jgi:hypothetical protein
MASLERIGYLGVEFEITADRTRPAWFAFGLRKSGSSIMNSMVNALADMNAVRYVDVAGRLFEKGVTVPSWQNDAGMQALLRGGNLFGGFRNAPLGLVGHPLLAAGPKILLVRDPRDALVSDYFSSAFSHSLPAGGDERDVLLAARSLALQATIGEWVLRRAEGFRQTMRDYDPFLAMPGMLVYRYEQAILDKRWFLRDVCRHFGWTVTDQQLGHILGWADVMPDEEKPTQFVRKVRPGDHRDKLDAETIGRLNGIFAAELEAFGYPR